MNTGTKLFKRNCQPLGGVCEGKSTKIETCSSIEPCNNAEWTEWTAFRECSKSCGGGIRIKTRKCSIRGKCEGSGHYEEPCATSLCPSWSQWRIQGSCSATCEKETGYVRVTRKCSVPGMCDGNDSKRLKCSVTTQCVGEWSSWESVECSVTCGEGVKIYTRTCSIGNTCPGSDTWEGKCRRDECPQLRESCSELTYDDKCFYMFREYHKHNEAVEKCRSTGGQLAMLKTRGEYDAVADYYSNKVTSPKVKLFWLGGSYNPRKGGRKLVWDDGEVSKHDFWSRNWPRSRLSYYHRWTNIVMRIQKNVRKGLYNLPGTISRHVLCEKEIE